MRRKWKEKMRKKKIKAKTLREIETIIFEQTTQIVFNSNTIKTLLYEINKVNEDNHHRQAMINEAGFELQFRTNQLVSTTGTKLVEVTGDKNKAIPKTFGKNLL